MARFHSPGTAIVHAMCILLILYDITALIWGCVQHFGTAFFLMVLLCICLTLVPLVRTAPDFWRA